MSLPKQVQRQADAAAHYDEQVLAANQAANTPPNEPPQEDPPQQQIPQPAPAAPAPQGDDPNSATWEQRARSAQGRLQTIVPQLQARITELEAAVRTVTQRADEAEARLRAAPQPNPQPAQQSELVTKSDVDAFGSDLVDLARRVAREEFGQREQAYRQEIAELQRELQATKGSVGEVAQNQQRNAAEQFFSGLDRAVPNWQAVQATPECQTWLASRVPGTTVTWDQTLKDAAARRDLQAVVELFETFYERYPQHNPAAKPTPRQTQTAQELQRQVAPTKSNASSSQVPQNRRVYSAKDYQDESMRQLRLMQAGKYDEAQRLENELNTALAEGRVSPN